MMNRRAFPLLACALLALPLASNAQDEPRGASFQVFGGASALYSSTNGLSLRTESTGVSGGFSLTRVWTLEAGLSRSGSDNPAWNGEISAKAYLYQADRFRLFGLVGPGIRRQDVAGRSTDMTTVHAGIGGEIGLSARTYLRPEVRARWPTSHFNERTRSTDYTLGFGWRF
jgi:hypothetical protein